MVGVLGATPVFANRTFSFRCCGGVLVTARYDQRAEALGFKGMIQTDNM